MSFRLLGLAAAAAVTTLVTVTPASAGCWSCGCAAYGHYGYYVQPRVVYVRPPCAAYYPSRPVYVVNQGPTFTEPVHPAAMPSPYVKYPPRPYPYGASAPRWHDYHYRHHRPMRGHFYRVSRRAPMYHPHHHVHGPRVLHVPRRYQRHHVPYWIDK